MTSQRAAAPADASAEGTHVQDAGRGGRRNPALGIVACSVAAVLLLSIPVGMVLVTQPRFLDQAVTISGRVAAAQLLAVIVASGLGVAAMITRRGSGWGIAALAVVVGVLLTGLVLPLLVSLVGPGA
jgi:hypothetical protein